VINLLVLSDCTLLPNIICCYAADAPVETREKTDPPTQQVVLDTLYPYDGNCLMKVSKLEDFIKLSTAHAAQCGYQLAHLSREMNCGAYIRQVYKCTGCGKELVLENCDKVKSIEVADGASHSRHQPDFNLRMVTEAVAVGINTQKLEEFMTGGFGIQIPHDHNLRKQETKVRKSIGEAFKHRKTENRSEHVQAYRDLFDYSGDIKWTEDGDIHSTSAGDISIDGGYCTRSYNNHHRGTQAAVVANSKLTKKPLALECSQVSFIQHRNLF